MKRADASMLGSPRAATRHPCYRAATMALVSVVIPTRDTRELTLRCLGTLRRPRAAALEVVVVDDGSTDATAAEIRARFPEVRLLVHERPRGYTHAANAGAAVTSGDPLVMLNSDTELGAGALDVVVAAFDDDPDLGIAGGRLSYPDGRPQWSGGTAPTRLWMFVQASGLAAALASVPGYRRLRPASGTGGDAVDWVTGAAMAIRRRVWRDHGPFDPRFELYCQDLDLCLAAGGDGWRVAVLDGFDVVHHHGATVAADPASADRFHPARMWADLVRLAAKRYGPETAGKAAAALRAGARCRLLGRRLRRAAGAAGGNPAWDADTDAFAAGLERLRDAGLTSPAPPPEPDP